MIRFLADADWDTVEKSCEIDDPYITTQEEAEVEDSLDVRPNSICPECDAKLPAQYTRKELRDMTNEAILRMLKAEKVMYFICQSAVQYFYCQSFIKYCSMLSCTAYVDLLYSYCQSIVQFF